MFVLLCLDPVAGIPPEMLVEAHGTFATATCTTCLRKYEGKDLRVSRKTSAGPQTAQFYPEFQFFRVYFVT